MHLQKHLLDPVKHFRLNFFARIVNVFKLTLLNFFKRFHRRYLQGPITPLICSNAVNKLFINPWIDKSVWACKRYQSISGVLVFMIVFGIHYNLLIALYIINFFIFSFFFFFTRQNMLASEVLRARSASGAQFVQACLKVSEKFSYPFFSL